MNKTRDTSSDWATVATAADELGKHRATVYKYLDDAGDRIRTMRVRDTLLVHLPSLREYEATRRPGRPRRRT